MSSPAVLAAFVRQHLDAIEADPMSAARIGDAVSPETLKTIREVSRIARVPLAVHAELNAGLFEIVDSETARAICRDTVVTSFRQPFLEPLVTSALKILGSEVGRFARWAPKAYSALFRDMGTMSWEPGEAGEGRLVVREAPTQLVGDPCYLAGMAAGFEALFVVTNSEGDLSIAAGDGRITMTLWWGGADAPSTAR